MGELREKIGRALYEHFVGEDFLNEYAPWPDLAGKDEWLERADVVLAIPEIAEAVEEYPKVLHDLKRCMSNLDAEVNAER